MKLQAEDLFETLEDEKEEEIRELILEKAHGLDGIISCFLATAKFHKKQKDISFFEVAQHFIPSSYSAADVNAFCLDICVLKKNLKYVGQLGEYISFLVNHCEDDEIRIRIPPHHIMHGLGIYLENKELIIEGNGGKYLGNRMKSGKIIVKGNAGTCVGYRMEGGEIIVEGNVKDHCCHMKKNGTVIIKKNVGEWAGNQMEAGLLEIYGKAADHLGSFMYGGKLIVHGKVTRSVGFGMQAGEIHLNGPYNKDNYKSYYKPLPGGKVFFKGKIKREGPE